MIDPMKKNGLGPYEESRNQRIGKNPALHNEAGIPVTNDEIQVTAGMRGSTVLNDAWLLEKNAHFNREVIPERRMHAKGSGAFGTFRVTNQSYKRYYKVYKKIGRAHV